jgi:phosphate transport system substrate-binding protein
MLQRRAAKFKPIEKLHTFVHFYSCFVLFCHQQYIACTILSFCIRPSDTMAYSQLQGALIMLFQSIAAQRVSRLGATFAALVLCMGAAQAQVTGTGATSVRDLMATWTAQYGGVTGGASYEATGSSVGVSKVTEQSVDFGVTDVPLTAVALRQAGLRQVPIAATAVAIIVNLPELAGKPLKLNGDILADIYQGAITQWNHSQIVGANPGLPLPNKPIVPIWRADGSGQSYEFSTYLARYNAKWRRSGGSTYNINVNAGKGARGGQALVDLVKATPGAIGYDGIGAAQKSGLLIAELKNADGKSIAPSAASIGASVETAQWSADANAADLDGVSGAGVYPITTVAYVLMPTAPKAGRKNAQAFIQAAVAQGDAQVRQVGLVPLGAKAKAVVAGLR